MRKALTMNNLHVKDQYCRFRKRVGILKPLKRLKFRPYPTLHIFSVTYSQKSTYIPPSFYIVLYLVYIVLIQNTARARVAQWVRKLDYLSIHTRLSPIQRGFVSGFVNYKKGCTRLAVASDKVDQLLAHGRWFSLGTPASSTTKTGGHDIAEIVLKVALNTKKQSEYSWNTAHWTLTNE